MASSGRLAYIKTEDERKRLDAVQERIAKQDAAANRSAARRMLQKLLVDFAGWQGLDEWAKDALDKLERGETLDNRKLRHDIEEWRSAHNLQSQEPRQTPQEDAE